MGIQTPDPPREEAAITENENIQLAMSDSDGDEEDVYEGYEMLPADSNDADDYLHVPEEDIIEAIAHQSSQPPQHSTFDQGVAQELKDVWNASSSSQRDPMDPQVKEDVLKAMKNFSLPSTSIPQWAKEVGEDDWKRHLLQKIRDESQ